jgi:hypothetical protein
MVSWLVLSAAPVEALPVLLVSWLSWKFCAALVVEVDDVAAVVDVVAVVEVGALVDVAVVVGVGATVAAGVEADADPEEALLVDEPLEIWKAPAPGALVCVPLSAPPAVLT